MSEQVESKPHDAAAASAETAEVALPTTATTDDEEALAALSLSEQLEDTNDTPTATEAQLGSNVDAASQAEAATVTAVPELEAAPAASAASSEPASGGAAQEEASSAAAAAEVGKEAEYEQVDSATLPHQATSEPEVEKPQASEAARAAEPTTAASEPAAAETGAQEEQQREEAASAEPSKDTATSDEPSQLVQATATTAEEESAPTLAVHPSATTNNDEEPPSTPLKDTAALPDISSPAPSLPPKSAAPALPPKSAPPLDVAAAFGALPASSKGEPSTPSLAAPLTPQLPSTPQTPATPSSGGIKIGKGPPPTTPASEERPFDFNRFLEQMRTRSAAPVGEYVRSFIKGFTKKPYRVSDQSKLIFDFLAFISGVMRQTAPFSTLSESEFENALEAMEKLIMNRLYTYTFSPAIAREGKWKVQTDDLERDRVFRQRVRLFGWITEEHLDVPQGDHSRGFVDFAVQELSKINHYKAPRDKLICILNCCKVIFGMIRHLSSQESADTFIPVLIFVVLRSSPDNLISNVEYISRFRNPDRLSSESGYYLSSLMGAIAFIETMDYTSLSNITQEEFESKVELAIRDIAANPPDTPSMPEGGLSGHAQTGSMGDVMGPGDENAKVLPAALSVAEDARAFISRTSEVARAGLGASLGRPMGALGRLLSDGLEGVRTPNSNAGSGTGSPSGNGAESPASGAGPGAGRRLFSGFFGGDDEAAGSGTPSRPTSGYGGNASWSRAFRGPTAAAHEHEADEEFGAPMSDELRQGPFNSLAAQQQQAPGAPRRTRRGLPGFPGHIDTSAAGARGASAYQDDEFDEDVPSTGVQTPVDEEFSTDAPLRPHSAALRAQGAGRGARLADQLADFQPSFLADTPTRTQVSSNEQTLQPGPMQEARDVARESEEISRVHLAAGVETLKSIFPSIETGVIEMVLESCAGDVQASIDKLLEMS